MDWRRRIAAYDDARLAHGRAERLLADAIVGHDLARKSAATALEPLSAGVDLARRRARREESRLARAIFQLTEGRTLDEAIWSLPDEL